MTNLPDIHAEWVHVSYAEPSGAREVYGFAGSQASIHLEGVRYLPQGVSARTLLIYMHPASTLQLLPMPRAIAGRGVHVLCAASRYARNDTPLIFEKVVLDLGAWIRHAREVWGYDKVVLCGWSGGGSLALMYQSQAERPTITHTPAGDEVDLVGAGLLPADAMIVQAAHISRAQLLADWIDPSVLDENDPDRRDSELDLYDPRNANQPPYTPDFLAHFRARQLERLRRRTDWVKETLHRMRSAGDLLGERGFVTHRTMAEPRFLDPALDPNERKPGTSYLGDPRLANSAPAGMARFSTLRAWLSQWSIDDTQAHGERAAPHITVPLLCIENGADDAVPQPHTGMIHRAAGSKDKTMVVLPGASHYYAGQPEQLAQALDTCLAWLGQRRLLES
ncbi:alpha/beta hydrolase family protein [Hydrogenophaga sp.]|uniref:alpha/beta hydrolase family protein n=1 Tax=Hydrogenophaga sp. TaxID=1904254 RepID=UPI003F729D16